MDLQLKGRMKVQNNSVEQALRTAVPPPVSTAKMPQHVPTVAEAHTIERNVYTNSNLPVTVWKHGLANAEIRKTLQNDTETLYEYSYFKFKLNASRDIFMADRSTRNDSGTVTSF